MCFDDTSRELPEDYSFTEYLVEWDRRYVYLTLNGDFSGNTEPEEKPKPMALRFLKGTEGISQGRPFSEDETVLMQIHENYYMEGEKLTLSDSSGSTDYKYELTENQIKINNLLGENVLSLIKK